MRTATNSLETMLESQRAADSRTTGERQADLQVRALHFPLISFLKSHVSDTFSWSRFSLVMMVCQAQCKATGTFTELVTSELHARDSDLANYFFNEGREQKTGGEK